MPYPTASFASNGRFIVTGAPGAGKTTTLDRLAAAGHTIVADSARAIIRARLAAGLSPRPSPHEFMTAIVALDQRQYEEVAGHPGPVFFDRALPDALASALALGALTVEQVTAQLRQHPFERRVFLFPAWRAIYRTDAERDHTFAHARNVHLKTARLYENWGFEVVEMAPDSVAARAARLRAGC